MENETHETKSFNKRLISLYCACGALLVTLLVCVLVITLTPRIPTYASFVGTVAEGDFNYEWISGQDVRITGLAPGKNPTHINIPDTVTITGGLDNPYNVTEIAANAFLNNATATQVTIGEKVVTIGDNAFRGCDNLSGTLIIPDSVTTIGRFAFSASYTSGSTNLLTEIVIGHGLTSLGDCAFFHNYIIETLVWNAVNYTTPFSSYEGLGGNDNPFGTYFGSNNPAGIDVIIGPDAQRIPDNFLYVSTGYSFRRAKIKSLTFSLPSSLKYIGSDAFYCHEIPGTLTIPDTVTTIGAGAFYGCANLASVTIGTGLTSLGNNAFTGCSAVETLTWNAANYTSYFAPFDELTATDHQFYNFGKGCGTTSNSNYVDVVIGNNVLCIPNNFLGVAGNGGRPNCKTLTFSPTSSLKTIGWGAFIYQNITGTLEIPDSVTTIGNNAFLGCVKLTSLTIGTNLTSLGASAFGFSSAVQTLNWNAENYQTVFPTTSAYHPFNYFGLGCGTDSDIYFTSVYIGNNVQNIPENFLYVASENRPNVRALTFNSPSSLTSIGENAFRGLNIDGTLTIPDTVQTIGANAFNGCANLPSLTIGSGVQTIGDNAFDYCIGLTGLLTIPANVQSIGEEAFFATNYDMFRLERYTAPGTITTLGIGSNWFPSATQRIIVPLGSSPTYKTAANWTTYAGIICEDIPEISFAAGDTPEDSGGINGSVGAMTWPYLTVPGPYFPSSGFTVTNAGTWTQIGWTRAVGGKTVAKNSGVPSGDFGLGAAIPLTLVESDLTQPANSVIWYPVWAADTTVSPIKFNNEKGTNPNPTTYVEEVGLELLDLADVPGYKFKGWYDNEDLLGDPVTEIDELAFDLQEFWAKWEEETYEITYKDKDNTVFTGIYGIGYPTTHTYDTATTLVNPTKAGYTFGGWYIDAACSTSSLAALSATGYTTDITLFAKWTAITYFIHYNLDDGTNSSGNPETFTIESGLISLQTPTKSGYKFLGWSLDTEDGEIVDSIPAGSTEDVTLYAHWEIEGDPAETPDDFPWDTVIILGGGLLLILLLLLLLILFKQRDGRRKKHNVR